MRRCEGERVDGDGKDQMRGEERVARFVRLAPGRHLLLDVGTLGGICMPWIATNRYRLVRRIRILMCLRNSGSMLYVRMTAMAASQAKRLTK